MDDYKPNSHRFKEEKKEAAKEERKKLDKVVGGKVAVKKKGEMSKFADVFISEDASNVKSYILLDVLVPAIKKAVVDIVTDGINIILYGGSSKSGNRSRADKISYQKYYGSDRRDHEPRRTGYEYDDIVIEDRGEAEEVLTRMDELLETYGMVSVADMCDLVGVSCNFTDNKYGWTNLRNASIVRVRDGYKLKLPKALPIS